MEVSSSVRATRLAGTSALGADWHSPPMEYRERDIGLVLWSVNTQGAGSAESIASRLPQDMTVTLTAEALTEAEGRGLVRELAGIWALTEAGRVYVGRK